MISMNLYEYSSLASRSYCKRVPHGSYLRFTDILKHWKGPAIQNLQSTRDLGHLKKKQKAEKSPPNRRTVVPGEALCRYYIGPYGRNSWLSACDLVPRRVSEIFCQNTQIWSCDLQTSNGQMICFEPSRTRASFSGFAFGFPAGTVTLLRNPPLHHPGMCSGWLASVSTQIGLGFALSIITLAITRDLFKRVYVINSGLWNAQWNRLSVFWGSFLSPKWKSQEKGCLSLSITESGYHRWNGYSYCLISHLLFYYTKDWANIGRNERIKTPPMASFTYWMQQCYVWMPRCMRHKLALNCEPIWSCIDIAAENTF